MTDQNQPKQHHGLQIPEGGPAPHNRLTYDWLFTFVSGMLLIVLNIFSLPAECFCRKKFGERYIATPMLMMSFFYVMVFTYIGQDQLPMFDNDPNYAMGAFAFLYLLVGAYHWISARLRTARGELWHSFSPGVSLFPPLITMVRTIIEHFVEHILPRQWTNNSPTNLRNRAELIVISYVDPALWLALGFLVIPIFGGALEAVWLISGCALVFKGILNRHFSKTQILDMIDAHLEAQHRNQVMTGITSPSEAAGVNVWAPPMTPAAEASYAEALSAMPPTLGKLIDQDPGQRSTHPPS